MTPDSPPASQLPGQSEPTSPPSQERRAPLRRLLPLAIGARIFNDTGIQIFGPYLAAIAAGLGISIVSLGFLNSLRSLMGLAAPVVGSIADNIGYRMAMRGLLLLGAAGMFILALSSDLWVATAGMLLMGLGVFSFAPVLQAYMSAQIPYRRRSRVLGIVEYGWALAGIVGLSVAGLLIERFGWRAPFLGLGTALCVAFFLFGAFPATPGTHSAAGVRTVFLQWRKWPAHLLSLARLESNARSAWAAILVNGLNVYASASISIVYGVWLSREYGVSTSRLGLVALTLGMAELSGSVLVSLVGDRLGKGRSVLGSSALALVAYVLLPALDFQTLSVVVGLVIARFLFEFSIVSNISLLSEQVPAERGKVLALAAAVVTTGAALASVTGPLTYEAWGISGPAAIAAISALVAVLLTVLWVNDRHQH